MNKITHEPGFATAPGVTLLETLEATGLTPAELGRRAGISQRVIQGILDGQAAISPEAALAFEKELRVPARFWLTLDRRYQERGGGGIHQGA